MRVMLIGSNGALGSDLAVSLKGRDLVALNHEDIEISDIQSVQNAFKRHEPGLVINTAAFHNVPECQKDDIKAFQVNALGAKFLAESCQKHGSVLVHVSTDYVFDGLKRVPYNEDDLPGPLNVYGITKLSGEHYISSIMKKFFIVRTSGLYGINKCRAKGGNFVDTVLSLSRKQKELKIVADEVLTPTSTADLADQIVELSGSSSYGVYHVTNSGSCSWYEFASSIFAHLRMDDIILTRISQDDFVSSVRRPLYSVLDNGKLIKLGMYKMRSWQEALSAYLDRRKELGFL